MVSGDDGMGLTEVELSKPADIWSLFESQLDASLKINFRVHRP